MMRKLILLLVLFPICSYAADIRDTLYIRANSSTLDWDVSAGTHWEAVADSDGAYIYTDVTEEIEVFLLDSLDAGKGFQAIDSVRHHTRARAFNTNARMFVRLYIGVGYASTTSLNYYILDSPWNDKGHTIARPGGGSWSVGDIDTLKLGFRSYTFSGTLQRDVDFAWVEIFGNDDIPASGPPLAVQGPDGAAVVQGPAGKSPVHNK